MKLYFSPLACSLATRIVLYEADAAVQFEEVDGKSKLTASGQDFRRVHPLALVPTLELDEGGVLSENAAVLQYVARSFPDARLAPSDPEGVARLQQWLCFIGTELHKALFQPLLDKQAPAEVKAYALSKLDSRLGWLEQRLAVSEFLLDEFSVADAYLFAVLNWTMVTPVDLKQWPNTAAYHARLGQRPSVARAFQEELALYRLELAREAAAPAAAQV